ncbi:LOW QUALITY PROTEIN: ATP-dependent Clp protease ATP-binding subunit CLPT2, chloroplastic [Glycine max]|uniref:LOW QUALITY PROTEIN: ATP-dependent Clp protease ATP-binding subunit CLPT2, chloroplastic n=1 Tax=Glycine max TaxID=3847 RepID=UPI001B3563AE|nr:LOW QUALITY PROTEIN: ATP-dependent Clp protease ATP-binding subunit CLPT2, chloroplastic [Glycine max]
MAVSRCHCPASLVFRSTDSSVRLGQTLTLKSFENSWIGTKVGVSPCSLNLRPVVSVSRRRPLAATVSFSLPTAKPERASTGQEIPKWFSKAIKSFAMSELEARKLKYLTTGTEALLMGVLIESTNLTAKFLRAHGITILKVRDETVKLLGKADLFFFSPEHPPLTDEAQRALDWAVDQKIKYGDGGEITTSHILLGIWSEVDSPGHKILFTLGFNDEKAKELEPSISKPGCTDD